MNDYDSFFLGILNSLELTYLTIIDDITLISSIWIDAAKYIHKCGLAGTVLSYKCMNLSLFNLKIDIVKSLNTWEGFGDVLHFKQYLSQNIPSNPLINIPYL